MKISILVIAAISAGLSTVSFGQDSWVEDGKILESVVLPSRPGTLEANHCRFLIREEEFVVIEGAWKNEQPILKLRKNKTQEALKAILSKNFVPVFIKSDQLRKYGITVSDSAVEEAQALQGFALGGGGDRYCHNNKCSISNTSTLYEKNDQKFDEVDMVTSNFVSEQGVSPKRADEILLDSKLEFVSRYLPTCQKRPVSK